jgi:nitroreductase
LRDKATAVRLKKTGVLAGMPDLLLAARRGGYGALFIELKRRDRSNHASPAQKVIHALLEEAGYRVCIAYGSEEAIVAIEGYLQLGA